VLRLNQSITLARFWAGLVGAGILLYYLGDAHDTIIASGRDAANSAAATQALDWSAAIWSALPFLITFVGLLGLVITAIYQRRGVVAG
jgi:hypothetical protein